jgi:hypothetical protein
VRSRLGMSENSATSGSDSLENSARSFSEYTA